MNNLRLLNDNSAEFLHRFITTDGTWVYHYTPESKEQFWQLMEKRQPAPKREE